MRDVPSERQSLRQPYVHGGASNGACVSPDTYSGGNYMRIVPLSGITERTVTTNRTTTRVLSSGSGRVPVVFLHDSPASATFWEETMLALPAGYRAIAPDLRGHGLADPDSKISAVNGLSDVAADIIALMEEEGIGWFVAVGHGWGGSVAWRVMADYADRLRGVGVGNPYSPWGVGRGDGLEGKPVHPDFAGSGAALVKAALVEAITERQSANGDIASLPALQHFFTKPPRRERIDALLASIYSVQLGQFYFPGDRIPSIMWPRFAPGVWGPFNALSPMFAPPVSRLYGIKPKPPVLWIRGAADPVVSDESVLDPAVMGKRGELADWPGEDAYPPQPMVSQTRAVLDRYAEAGGAYSEVVIEDAGHTPFIETPEAFNRALHEFLSTVRR